MSDINITSTESDSTALAAIEQQHAEMTGSMGAHMSALLAAVTSGDQSAAQAARTAAASWSQLTLVAYLDAEEKVLYPVAGGKSEGRLLVEALRADHETIKGFVSELAQAPDGVRAVAAATALRVAVDGHLAKQVNSCSPSLRPPPTYRSAICTPSSTPRQALSQRSARRATIIMLITTATVARPTARAIPNSTRASYRMPSGTRPYSARSMLSVLARG